MRSPTMEQFRQRVIASYHLVRSTHPRRVATSSTGLRRVAWKGNPESSCPRSTRSTRRRAGFRRRINACATGWTWWASSPDQGRFTAAEVNAVVAEITGEIGPQAVATPLREPRPDDRTASDLVGNVRRLLSMADRVDRLEKDVNELLNLGEHWSSWYVHHRKRASAGGAAEAASEAPVQHAMTMQELADLRRRRCSGLSFAARGIDRLRGRPSSESGRTGDVEGPPHTGGVVKALTVDVEDYFQVSALAPLYGAGLGPSRTADRTQHASPAGAVCATEGRRPRFSGSAGRRNDCRRSCARWPERGMKSPVTATAMCACTSRVRQNSGLISAAHASCSKICQASASPGIAPQVSPSMHALYGLSMSCRRRGYEYSSSINPIRHDHYGMREAARFAVTRRTPRCSSSHPPPTRVLSTATWPAGGGGYFRLLPYRPVAPGASRASTGIDRRSRPSSTSTRGRSTSAAAARFRGVSAKTRFRHYLNLHRTESTPHPTTVRGLPLAPHRSAMFLEIDACVEPGLGAFRCPAEAAPAVQP